MRATHRRLWVWLLPVFLLLAQYGEYRHELAHFTKKIAKAQKEAPAKIEVCHLCLAFGHLSGAAKPEPVSAVLVADLHFQLPSHSVNAGVTAQLPATRNRGPPLL
jgi:hypothetical protein